MSNISAKDFPQKIEDLINLMYNFTSYRTIESLGEQSANWKLVRIMYKILSTVQHMSLSPLGSIVWISQIRVPAHEV